MLIMLILFSLSAQASEMASEKYCFNSPEQGLEARVKFKAIQVPSDAVTMDGRCFTVQMSDHRHELIQRFIRSSYPTVNISFSSKDLRREPCKLKVEKEMLKESESLQIDVTPSIRQTETLGKSHDEMKIQTLKEFNLFVNQDEIKGECRYITPDRYEITIVVQKNPKPSYPGYQSPDQETSTLQTVLQLSRGSKIEMGSTIKELRNKGHDVSIEPNLKIEASSQLATEKIFLSLD